MTRAATHTNKTLTAPVINSPTGIVKGDVALGNVDNTSDATKNAASVTLTNKTLTSPVINGTETGSAIRSVAMGGTGLSAPIYGTYYLSSNQSYTSVASAPVKVNLDTAETNSGLTFDGVTNRRVTIITAGRYLVSYQGYFIQGTAGDLIGVRVKKNGTTDIAIALVPAAAGSTIQASGGGAKVVSHSATDYLTWNYILVRQAMGCLGGIRVLLICSTLGRDSAEFCGLSRSFLHDIRRWHMSVRKGTDLNAGW